MPVPVFVGAGDGVSVTSGATDVTKASCTEGNMMILQTLITSAQSTAINSASNVENLAGTTSAMTIAPATFWSVGGGSGRAAAYFGRVEADGTVTVNVSASASAAFLARLYEFSGVDASSTTAAELLDNSESGTEVTQAGGTGTTITNNELTTTGADRLGLAFVSVLSDQAIAAFSGESGSDWVEAVAEFTSASPAGAMSLQIADMPSAGSITGGTITISSAGWAADITSMIGAAAATTDIFLPAHRRGR